MDTSKHKQDEKEGSYVERFESDIGVNAKGNKVAIIKLCKQNNVPYKGVTETIKEGWHGKPKGMLQILWERGVSLSGSRQKQRASIPIMVKRTPSET